MGASEWLMTAVLVTAGLVCLSVAGGLVAGPPEGPLARLGHWLMQSMGYVMAGLALLWQWAVWGVVASIWRARGEWECHRCGRPRPTGAFAPTVGRRPASSAG